MTKIALTPKARDDVKSLLEEHQAVSDALVNHGKSGFDSSLSVGNDDSNDFTTVNLTYIIAKRALTEQKVWIEAELAKRGIAVS